MRTIPFTIDAADGSGIVTTGYPSATIQYGTGTASSTDVAKRGNGWSVEVDETRDALVIVSVEGAATFGFTVTHIPEVTVSGYAAGQVPAKVDDIPTDYAKESSLSSLQNLVSSLGIDETELADAVWSSVSRTLTQELAMSLDEDQVETIASTLQAAIGQGFSQQISDAVITRIFQNLSETGRASVGRGRGSRQFVDVLADGSRGLRHLTVKAYSVVDGEVLWNEIKGMDITDPAGEYTLFLDPGDYVFVVEKAGRDITTLNKTVE